jgi:hypothetical protein
MSEPAPIKVTQLIQDTTPSKEDLTYGVDMSGELPASYSVTYEDLVEAGSSDGAIAGLTKNKLTPNKNVVVDGDGNVSVGSYNMSKRTYCVNSGPQNEDGYADFITDRIVNLTGDFMAEGTAVNDSSLTTYFLSEVNAGDLLYSTSLDEYREVQTVNTDASITLVEAFSQDIYDEPLKVYDPNGVSFDLSQESLIGLSDLTGTYDSVGTSITGTGSLFLSELSVGDYLYSESLSEYKEITEITDDLTLIIDSPFTSDVTGEPVTKAILDKSKRNLVVTFPNENTYEISELSDITGLTADGKYTFIIEEDKLFKLEDGTYTTAPESVKVNYSSIEQIPQYASAVDGYSAVYSGDRSMDPYVLTSGGEFSRNNRNADDSGGYSTVIMYFPEVMNLTEFSLNNATIASAYNSPNYTQWTWSPHVRVSVSTDGGSNWGSETQYGLSGKADDVVFNRVIFSNETPANAIKFRFYRGYISGYNGDCFNYNTGINIQNFKLNYNKYFLGGNILEQSSKAVLTEDGDYTLNYGKAPYEAKKQVDGILVERSFIKLGEVIKVDGDLGQPVSYAYNAYFDSNYHEIGIGNLVTVRPNIGSYNQVTGTFKSSRGDEEIYIQGSIDHGNQGRGGFITTLGVNTCRVKACNDAIVQKSDYNVTYPANFASPYYFRVIAERAF